MFTKQWDEPGFFRWADASIEIFGAERCMLGSNFRLIVCTLATIKCFLPGKHLFRAVTRLRPYKLPGKPRRGFTGFKNG
jgi:hypothetical protein